MLYPWPIDTDSRLLGTALEIAMDYLERTGQGEPFTEVQNIAAATILTAWKAGMRHVIRLANCGIVAVQN